MEKQKCIVYIGDFDFRNENVQAHLVRNNGAVFNRLGYKVAYIGLNRKVNTFDGMQSVSDMDMGENIYFEFPNTLHIGGVLLCRTVCNKILAILDGLKKTYDVNFVITYQSPTYAVALKKIAKWCKLNLCKYIVNCADLPIFDLQPFVRKYAMKINWHYLHHYNKKYADGVIAVSRYIENFYGKDRCIIIPPLFDCGSAEPCMENTRRDVPTFLYAGRPFTVIGKEANPAGMKDRLDKILDLCFLLSEKKIPYRLIVVGITLDEYLSCVPRHREKLSQQTNIEFMGIKSHSETLQMVADADFTIQYRDENLMTKAGFSTKIVESVSLGTPVVTNRISDIFQYLKEGITGFELHENQEENLEKLQMLASLTPKERCEIKKKCYGEKTFERMKYQTAFKQFFDGFQI